MDLTDRPADAAAPHQLPPPERAGDDLLARALRRARWTIFWERLWPALASIATVIGLFLALSWLGLWLWLPPVGRAVGLGIFFLLTAAAFAPVLMLRVPSRIEGLRRLDRNSGLPHRPATAIADEIAAPTEDSFSVALWRAHIERALRAAKTLRAGTPMPRLALRDPFAVRALVVVLVVATFFAAGGERMKRVAAAFDWQGVMMPANFRVDAWVSPPPYTGRPPIILPGLRPGEPVQTAAALSVPAGSTLVVRATGIHLDVVASGGLAEPSSGAQSSNAKGTEERRFVINDAGAATVRGAAASDVTWQFTAIPDKPPTIALAKEPEGQARGALQLSYKLEDDYGVIGAQASVLTALDALTLAPEQFNMESNVYLGLRAIFWQLARAKSDDQLRDVVARMWDMAVHLEDGSVSDAEQALRAAEEALRQALERGASDEEIKRLTDQLRAALDKFMQALAEQMRKNPQQLARPLDPNARQLRPQDLRNMIDRLEQMARSGARDAARRMLQDLQQMLENLQMARPGQQMDGDGNDDMMSALDELGDMIRKQQQLRDRTFQQGQDQRRDGQLGPPRAQQETDPLGRPLRGRDYGDDTTIKVPGEIDVQRARRILEELRRRFGETFRPQLELDYIERLLRDY